MLADVVLLEIAFVISFVLRNGLDSAFYTELPYQSVSVFIAVFGLCAGFFIESYSGILRRGYWLEFKAVCKHVGIVYAFTLAYMFIIKRSSVFSRISMVIFPVLAVLLLYCGRLLLKIWLTQHKGPAMGKRAIMLIGGKSNYKEMIDDFQKSDYSEFKVMSASIMDGDCSDAGCYNGVKIVCGKKPTLDYLCDNWVDEVLISFPRELPMSEELVDTCLTMGITVHFKLTRITSQTAHQFVEKIENYTVLTNSVNIVTPREAFMKRMLDIAGGLVGCLLTGILFIFVAPAIYIKSPGPIFFKQKRVGRNGRRFFLYKFRSMYMDAEERKKELMEKNNIKDGMMFKMDNDPRIIKGIGNFIRDYSIDEFPQFWNVLKGDMSLVGTRPPTVDEWEKYDYHHRGRLAIKPGITGLWQVSGRSDITDFEEVVRLDKEYITKWSIGQDIRILFQTVGVVLEKKGAQ